MATLLVAIGSVHNANAQASYNKSYTRGVEVTAGDEYFLYNIGEAKFLTGGMDWGSHASTDHAGKILTLANNVTGYSIYSTYYSENGLSNPGYLTTNAFMDTESNDADWVFTPVTVNGYTNAYTISNGTDYLYANHADTRVNIGANTNNNYSYWLLIPKSERDAKGDYTYYLQNQGINRFWQRACWSGCTWGNDQFATGGNADNPCGEKYHATLDFYQQLTTALPNATYKVYAQGFWRQDGSGAAPKFYANSDMVDFNPLTGSENNMNEASTAFSNGLYVNEISTNVTDGKLRVGINISATDQWVIWDNFFIQRVGDVLSNVAVALPANGDMAADTWYYVDVATTDLYSFNTTTFADILYVTDGTLDVYEAYSQATNFANEAGTNLEAGRYYIRSASANHFEIENISPATAADMQQLAAAITAAEAHTLGFENGEYAPYNNVAALTLLAQAKAIDQTAPANYVQNDIEDLIDALQNATWTANTAEVNAVGWKTDYAASDIASDGYIHPVGWTNTGYNTRVYSSTAGNLGTNTGLSAVDGTGIMFKYNTTYGETIGYTMPLKANTYYKISFKYCGWGNTPTTNVVMTLNGTPVTVTPASFRPETSDGNTNSEHWYEYNAVFETGEAGDYVLAFNKVEGGQQQIAFGDMLIVKADVADMPYTLATGPMNVDVAAAQAAAEQTYQSEGTVEAYKALLAAIDAANASVAVYQQINARLELLTAADQRGDLTEAQVKAMSFYTKYSDGSIEGTGTYTSLNEVVPEYKANIAAYYATNAPAENEDLTAFIVNNGFEFGNLTEWNLPYGTSAQTGVFDFAEKVGNYLYNSWWYGKPVQQTIADLPNGTYRLTAGLCSGDDAATPGKAFLTANGNHSDVITLNFDGNRPLEDHSFDFVVSNGTATIGAIGANTDESFNPEGYWWFRADNFRLTFLTSDITIAPTLVNAPMNADIRQAQQDAYDTWNANKSLENYRALEDAIAAAQTSADKYVIISNRIPKLDDQTAVDVSALTTKYNDGEYVEADDVFEAYRVILGAAYANPADNTDMTEFIINPDFEWGDADGWGPNYSNDTGVRETASDTYRMTNSNGNYLFNSWSNSNAFLWIVQEVTNLPAGTYELSAVWAGYNDTQIEFTAENVQQDGTINEEKLSFKPYDEDNHADANTGQVKTLRFYVSDGKVKVGGHAWGFFKCDNYRLTYISQDIDLVDTNQPMNRYERENYLNALAEYQADPSSDNLHALIKYKLIAENSIEAYKAAAKTFDRVLSMMNKTNVYTFDAYFTIDDMYRKYGPEEGYYHYETLEDDVAFDLERMFFGAGHYRNYVDPFGNPPNLTWMGDIPAVPFIASAWDCGYDGYAYRYKDELELPGGGHWKEGDDYYCNTWSTEGLDDGTNMYNPYLEYWLYGDQLLAPKTMTATVDGTPGKEYTVKMFVRVRTIEDHQTPAGMSIQIGDGTPVTPNWQYVDNESSYYVLNNRYRLWVCNLWDYAEADLPKGYVDQDGKLRIKFIMEPGETNITWLSFRDVYVNYDGEDLTQALADLQAEVDYANANYYANLGFDPDEYAPYTNVDELIALKRAQQVHDASENYFLVKAAYDKLYEYNHGGDNGQGTWTKNPYEMNGFYWTDDYTAEDLKHVEWYGEEDDCITPSGWNLVGRADGFNTGIVKMGVNNDGEGLKSAEGETVLNAKYETDYGQEIGYTLPLKAGVKYILTFTYAYDGDDPTGCPFETRISLSAPKTGVENVLTEPLTVDEIQPLLPNGSQNQSNWYMYRATFVPTFTADYVITFDKDNVDSEPMLYGDLTLVRYYDKDEANAQNNKADYVINGDSHDFEYSLDDPKFEGRTVEITRTFQKGTYTTLVLPFKLSETELKEALGENFDGNVYVFTGAERTDTEGYDYYQLKFETQQTGIFPNKPILFFNDANNPVNDWSEKVFNKMVTKRVENNLTIDAEPFDLVGTYETMKIPNGGWYLKNNEFRKSSGKANLSPTCAYFIPFDSNGDPILGAKLMGFSIDDTPTGIIAIEEDGDMIVTSGNIYTIDGRLVRKNATSLEGLEPGTYVVDGKKYIIR